MLKAECPVHAPPGGPFQGRRRLQVTATSGQDLVVRFDFLDMADDEVAPGLHLYRLEIEQ